VARQRGHNCQLGVCVVFFPDLEGGDAIVKHGNKESL
jgi:hypothetical protein